MRRGRRKEVDTLTNSSSSLEEASSRAVRVSMNLASSYHIRRSKGRRRREGREGGREGGREDLFNSRFECLSFRFERFIELLFHENNVLLELLLKSRLEKKRHHEITNVITGRMYERLIPPPFGGAY